MEFLLYLTNCWQLIVAGRMEDFFKGVLPVVKPHVSGWPDIQDMAAQAELAGVNKGGHRVGRVGKRG